MVSMKKTKKEVMEDNPVDTMMPGDQPNYPHGLKLRLEDDELAKLSFNVRDHKVGEVGELKAKFVIESMESQKTDQGEEDQVCLQITHIDFSQKSENWTIESKK